MTESEQGEQELDSVSAPQPEASTRPNQEEGPANDGALAPAQSSETQTRLAALENAVTALKEQLGYLPPQVRMLGDKIDGLTTSVSEPRLRALLMGLLDVFDLVERTLNSLPPDEAPPGEVDHRNNYRVFRTQLGQLLESNGLREIPAEGAFDPQLHRAVRRVPCDSPDQDGCIVEVVRTGFQTEHNVLRYAEVNVGQYSKKIVEDE